MIFIYNKKSSFISSFHAVDSEVALIHRDICKSDIVINSNLWFILQFALRELFNNAVEHGNKFDESKVVNYSVSLSKRLFDLQVSDSGEGFDPDSIFHKEHSDDFMRLRNRGLTALCDMGFVLKGHKNKIQAKLNIEKFQIRIERTVSEMDIRTENQIAYCVLKSDLVSSNIQALIEITKSELKNGEEFNQVILDFTSCKSVDSMGITFLIGIYKTYTSKNKKLILKGVSDSLLNLFKIMKLDEIFEFADRS